MFAGLSRRRIIEAASHRLFGPTGLGISAAWLWTKRKVRAKDKPTVLVISNILFDKDIAEIDREGRFNWVSLQRLSKILDRRILSQPIRVQRHYYATLDDPKYRHEWENSERFGLAFLRMLRFRGPIDAVFSSHVDYWQDEGIRRACARLGIPFLALCHENYNVPKTFRTRSEEFTSLGFRFNGTAVATFSPHIKEMFAKAGICSADRIVVTGAPRLDGWLRVQNKPARRIVLLSFLNPHKYYTSAEFFFSVLDALREIVEQRPDLELVVKCKGGRDAAAISNHVGSHPRIVVGREMPIPETLSTASVVVGGNSLSMVEALLSGASLFIPVEGGVEQDPDTSLFDPNDPKVREHLHFAPSLDDLKKQVNAALDAGVAALDRASRVSLVQRYIHFTENEASGPRVADFIECFLKSNLQVVPAAVQPDLSDRSVGLSHHNTSVRP